MTMITKLVKKAMPRIKTMGREEIAKAHAAGKPGIYMIDGEIVAEYPSGEIVSISEHRQRITEATAAQIDIAGLSEMTEDEIDELADQLVKEARAKRDDS